MMNKDVYNVLLILHVKYFYNRLRFKVVIDRSCRGHFFLTQCIYNYAEVSESDADRPSFHRKHSGVGSLNTDQ